MGRVKRYLYVGGGLVVLAAIGAGLLWAYRNSDAKILEQAQLEIRANNIERALKLARKYTANRPGVWRGHYVLAQAYVASGQYDDARGSLQRAVEIAPKEVSIGILMAETYRVPARKGWAAKDLPALREAMDLYSRAMGVLDTLEPADRAAAIDVQIQAGMVAIETAALAEKVVALLEKAALSAEARRDAAALGSLQKEVVTVRARSSEAHERAKKLLLAAIVQDPSRETAATALVELCLRRRDDAALAAAKAAILGAKDQPPVATMLLVLQDLRSDSQGPGPVDPQKVAAVRSVLEGLVSKHPDNTPVKLSLADLLMQLPDVAKARDLCKEVLKADSRNVRALLLEANILLAQGDIAQAEVKLSSLSSRAGDVPEVHFARGRAALAAGKPEIARESLRAMARIPSQNSSARLMQAQLASNLGDLAAARQLCEEVIKSSAGNIGARLLYGKVLSLSGDLAGAEKVLGALKTACPRWPDAQMAYAQIAARSGNLQAAEAAAVEAARIDPENTDTLKFLAGVRLRQSKVEQGFADARRYHESHRDVPAALGLLVEAAVRTDQQALARKVLEEAVTREGSSPEMLIEVYQGYLLLKDPEAARKAALKAADSAATSSQARLAVARACMALDRMPKAERLLVEELKRNPANAAAEFYLGQINAATGRSFPAIDRYRLAADLDRANPEYQVSLAKALLDSGDLEESARVLDSINLPNPTADALRLQVHLIRGQRVDMGKVLEQARGYEESALATALPYLAGGQLSQCVTFCQSQLAKNPNDVELRLLMAKALLGMGQVEPALEQWGLAIRSAPDRMSIYLEMAAALAQSGGADAIERRMGALAWARKELVAVAAGLVLAGEQKYEKAVEILRPVSQSKAVAETIRQRASLILAQAMAAIGRTDEALSELERLASSPSYRNGAAMAKVGILIRSGRSQEAEVSLGILAKEALEQRNISSIRGVVEHWLSLRRNEKALAVCDELQKLVPDDPKAYQIKASVLRSSDRAGEAVDCYRKAIELQPQNFQLHTELAVTLENECRFEEALTVLRRLEEASPAAASISLFLQGGLFARWGLQDQAISCFRKISNTRYGENPKVRLALGRALGLLGRRELAAESLKAIPAFSDEYIPAQVLLARMAGSIDAQIPILRALAKAKPGNQRVLVETMRLLLQANRPGEAMQAYRAFMEQHGRQKSSLTASEGMFLAVQAAIETQDLPGARRLALEGTQGTGEVQWRILAALLSDREPQEATAMLPPPETADLLCTLTALCLSPAEGSRGRWMQRLGELESRIGPDGPSRLAPDRLLVSMIQKDAQQTQSALSRVQSVMNLGKGIALEAATSPAATPAEAQAILKSSVALRLGLPALARLWAQEALRKRPTCQWAAAIAFQTAGNPRSREEIMNLLRPENCTLRRVMEAELCREKGDFARAAKLYADAARMENNDPALLLSQAISVEATGRLDDALQLYRQVWKAGKITAAANNIAYATIRLSPKDAAGLAQAQALVAEALRQAPQDATFLDTLGWLSYLRGQYEQASRQLRQAVRANPEAPDGHYHLAMAESACGRNDLARWHHQAVVNIVQATAAAGQPLSPDVRNLAHLAQESLDALESGK